MSKIKKKIYYRITFRLASALSVGSGENQYSDGDIIRNSAGEPFIPGSSLAGIYRSFLSDEDAEAYFGTAKNEDQGMESKVLVYDARLKDKKQEASYRSVIRDCVGLDEWKTAKEGCKFDFEVIEPGAEFVTYLEQNCEADDRDICNDLAAAWMNDRILIGRKTMRGLGSVKDVTVRNRSFVIDYENEENEIDKWLDFNMYCDEDWKEAELRKVSLYRESPKDFIQLEMILKQRGGISIRRYSTKCSEDKEKIFPDAEQLTCIMSEDGKEIPYIPGTSWAGAFRHHMDRLMPKCTEKYFGSCEKRSQIRFTESFLEGAKGKVITRNAVDRFTGGVVKSALFTEKIWYGGSTTLRIELPQNTDISFRQALAASLVDLHVGILSVGGLTAVGRGIFQGESLKINGKSIVPNEDMYGEILEELEGR